MNRLTTLTALPATALNLSGCNSMRVNDRPSLQESHVKPGLTEHPVAPACIGDLIDQKNAPQLSVYVRPIYEHTVPIRFEERRLSLGGESWPNTAIIKTGSDRVVSVTSRKAAQNTAKQIEISGAWTQDDFAFGERNTELRAERAGSVTDLGFFAGSRRRVRVIADGFVPVRNKRVIHATSISVTIGGQGGGFGLCIKDATDDVALDLSTSINEGPQFAKRCIAEAAACMQVSHGFDIDYRPCIELGWVNSTACQGHLKNHLTESVADRNRRGQVALKDAGHDPGALDGIWGRRSANAMMRFQSDLMLPVTRRPSAELYLSRLRHSPRPSLKGGEG